MEKTEQLYRIGKLGPVVKLVSTTPWQGLRVCEVVKAGNLQSHYGYVEHFTPGTVCWCKEHELEPVEADAS